MMRVRRHVSIPIDATFLELYQVTLAEWQSMPTLASNNDSDLKYDTGRYRVWNSRMSIADYDGDAKSYADERIQFEELIGGRWILLDRYGNRV
jgi:hypothetical protein